jgi:hypothetical protein
MAQIKIGLLCTPGCMAAPLPEEVQSSYGATVPSMRVW